MTAWLVTGLLAVVPQVALSGPRETFGILVRGGGMALGGLISIVVAGALCVRIGLSEAGARAAWKAAAVGATLLPATFVCMIGHAWIAWDWGPLIGPTDGVIYVAFFVLLAIGMFFGVFVAAETNRNGAWGGWLVVAGVAGLSLLTSSLFLRSALLGR